MSAVEIRLNQSELSREMAVMRVWLDEHQFEASRFSCHDNDGGLLLFLEFKLAHQARAFAERFGGRADDEETVSRPLPVGVAG